ncbi:MAG: ABC transporter substrate-binding protein [Pseudomonadota bacterium]
MAPAPNEAGTAQTMADLGCLKAGFEGSGSPRWIMDTIKRYRLDIKHGFRLEVDFIGDKVQPRLQSTEAALAADQVDFIDTDWISVARCRSQGLSISAVFPYGAIMGGLVVAHDSGIHGLMDIRGRRIGVVRLLDKNWAVMRAVCIKRFGFDPQAEASVQESGSKTALLRQLQAGEVEAALLYWHLIPGLVVSGRFRQVCDVLELVPELRIGAVPTTFFTFRDEFIARRPALIRAFIGAFCEAVTLMHKNDEIWAHIAEHILDDNNLARLHALRGKWETRICTTWNMGVVADLNRLFGEIKNRCGSEALGCDHLPAETFNYAFMN